MLTTRLVKTAMVASTALFALLVTLNNLVDYDSNYQFVRHTLSMDTTFPDNALMGRAITTPVLWTAGYWAIILRSSAISFNAAKEYAIAGAGLGFLLWFTGFMGIGGEWFLMWQSKDWNGQEPAFRFYMTLLVVMIFLNQPDRELGARNVR